MFGYVIQIRDTLLIIGVICVILYFTVLTLDLSTTPGTNWRRGYDTLHSFTFWMVLLPGLVFLAGYVLLRARVKHSAGKITKISKNLRRKKNAETEAL